MVKSGKCFLINSVVTSSILSKLSDHTITELPQKAIHWAPSWKQLAVYNKTSLFVKSCVTNWILSIRQNLQKFHSTIAKLKAIQKVTTLRAQAAKLNLPGIMDISYP